MLEAHGQKKKQRTDQIDGTTELLEETMLRGEPIEPHNAEFLRKFRSAKDRLQRSAELRQKEERPS